MITNDELKEQLDVIEELLRLSLRQKLSDKADKLHDEVMRRGRMTRRDVETYLGISKPYALNRMEFIGRQPGFSFVAGDSKKCLPSCVVFDESKILQDQYKIISASLQQQKSLSLYDLMQLFSIDLREAKLIAESYAQKFTQCKLVDNRLEVNQ